MKGFTSGETPIRLKESIEPRLISSIARTGRVIWQDDFETYTSVVTEKWVQAAGTISLATTYPFRGKQYMKILTGAVAGNSASAQKGFGVFTKGRHGIEFRWLNVDGIANVRYVQLDVNYYDGAILHRAFIRWCGTVSTVLTQKWQYYSSAGAWTDISGGGQVFNLTSADILYHHLKLTVDLNTGKYIKLISEGLTFDLSTISYSQAANTATPGIFIKLYIETEVAAAVSLNVDDFILTDLEP